MSGRVCYLGRTDRGDRLAVVRLVGAGSDQAWDAFGAVDAVGVRHEIGEAAAWIAERASRGDGPRGEVEVVCVDVEGGTCGWVTSPSAETSVVAAAVAGVEGDAWGGETGNVEATVQALAGAPAKAGVLAGVRRRSGKAAPEPARKLAVVRVPDVPVKLLVDALDERGVAVGRVMSLWQAMALSWDPSGPAASGDAVRGERVVASSSAVSAVVLLDPSGRLVWSWSRDGELVAGGSIRLAPERTTEDPGGRLPASSSVHLGPQEVGRLINDWIAWSLQLGQVPVRVLCLGPEGAEEADGLTPAALGSSLGKAWPGATVDLVVHEDPIGATLLRLARTDWVAGEAEEERTTLVALTRRPGRSHRAMFRWAALAVLAGALGLVGVAWRAWSTGEKALKVANAAEENVKSIVSRAAPPKNQVEQAIFDASPRAYLEGKIRDKRLSLSPTGGLEAAKPILPELETLSYVLAMKGVEVEDLQLQSTLAMVYVVVADTPTYENVMSALGDIGGSHITWKSTFSGPVNGKQRYLLEGSWKKAPAPGGGAGGGS